VLKSVPSSLSKLVTFHLILEREHQKKPDFILDGIGKFNKKNKYHNNTITTQQQIHCS